MSRLQEVTDYKNTIIQRLISSQDICKAVYYREPAFLSCPEVSIEDVLYKNIFPFNYIPTTQEEISEKKIYITISLTDFRKSANEKFKAGLIIIRTFMHKDKFVTDEGALRSDFIIQKIDEILNESRGIGIGKLDFVDMQEFMVNQDYPGAFIRYRPVDFN